MDKRFVYTGIILIFFGLIIFFYLAVSFLIIGPGIVLLIYGAIKRSQKPMEYKSTPQKNIIKNEQIEEGEDIIAKIKAIEGKSYKTPKDKSDLVRLCNYFKRLESIKYGSLAYLETTSVQAIKKIYKIDVSGMFERLSKKSISVANSNNPNNYAYLPKITLDIIEKTERNESIAKSIIMKIISSISE